MNIAVIGGGINGLCISWEAAKRGAQVTVFEKNKIMSQTSCASSKLLHGGLRYLENLDLKLVKEALAERAWWLENVPEFSNPIELHLPLFNSSIRSKTKYKIGLWLYDKLAGNKNIKNHQWLSKELFSNKNKHLKKKGLTGGFVFFDGQMLDYELGCWVAEQAISKGVRIIENVCVSKMEIDGNVYFANNKNEIENPESESSCHTFDFVINSSGSYTEQLLIDSEILPKFQLDHIRGSHLIIDRTLSHGYLFEIPKDKRVFFVLPYKNQTLIGTTEVRQSLSETIAFSSEEIDYLISAYNHYFEKNINKEDVVHCFSGLRPLIKSSKNFSNSSREYAIQQNSKIISIYGGKWTTARSLAIDVCDKLNL